MVPGIPCRHKTNWPLAMVCALGVASSHAAPPIRHADLATEGASSQVRQVAEWIAASRNNAGLPFAIVDKVGARVLVFSAAGALRGSAAALLGSARGDGSTPGIGDKKLSNIRPEERTTPAGRFEAEIGRNMRGEDILWVDYDGAVSLHRVVTGNLKEHRRQRLETPTASDNRITYGCINVSEDFYLRVVRPTFSGMRGIVYVLPEVLLVEEVFHSFPVDYAGTKNRLSGQ